MKASIPPREARLRVMKRKVPLPEWCEARVNSGWCTPSYPQPARHRHHRKRRSQGGPDTAVNTVGVCAFCHQHIHDNPAESIALGLLISSWDEISPYVPWWANGGHAA